MVKTLPERFNPDLMARDGTLFEVTLAVDKLERLRQAIAADAVTVSATATFSRRKDHIVVSGRLVADWPMICQRCVEPMVVSINEPYELVFVESEEAAQALSKALDPVVLDENGQIRLADLFEDEFLLHVPAIPKHDENATCVDAELSYGNVDAALAEESEGKKNPFDVLKKLDLH